MMIRDKADMYRRLAAGELGNTLPQWFDADKWRRENPHPLPFWGVRTLSPGGPCRLNCPAAEVPATFREFEALGFRAQISAMVDRVANVMLWADIWDSPAGLVVYGIEYPDTAGGWTWRNSMPTRGRHWQGTAAKLILSKHLNPNSLADLESLFAGLPGHVCEVSAVDRCYGTVPHRNAIVWEVRNY
jgi:hypothetical protein